MTTRKCIRASEISDHSRVKSSCIPYESRSILGIPRKRNRHCSSAWRRSQNRPPSQAASLAPRPRFSSIRANDCDFGFRF